MALLFCVQLNRTELFFCTFENQKWQCQSCSSWASYSKNMCMLSIHDSFWVPSFSKQKENVTLIVKVCLRKFTFIVKQFLQFPFTTLLLFLDHFNCCIYNLGLNYIIIIVVAQMSTLILKNMTVYVVRNDTFTSCKFWVSHLF